jgi:hypothetical protein
MNAQTIRNTAPRLAVAVIAAGALLALGACGKSDVTKARLERNLPQVFANLYVQQAKILGHKGITVQSLHAKASCDKGGPKVADHGPGADWICLMTWEDHNVDPTLFPGKFEVNAHSNDCYTAGGPSKLIGLLTITDTRGNDVPNPVFEFDSCFDPHTSNAPTGVNIQPAPTTTQPAPTAPPAVLTLPHGALQPDGQGRIAPRLSCSAGPEGCAGTVTATLDGRALGTGTYALAPGNARRVHFRLSASQRKAGGTVVLSVKPLIGTAPAHPSRLTVPKA